MHFPRGGIHLDEQYSHFHIFAKRTVTDAVRALFSMGPDCAGAKKDVDGDRAALAFGMAPGFSLLAFSHQP